MRYTRSFLGIVLILFTLQALLVCLSSVPWLLANFVSDDFFYYLVLARNYWRSGIYSFDGIEPTNGFHPLYLFILTPLAFFVGEQSVLFLKAALLILLIFHNGVGVVLLAGFSKLRRPEVGYLSGLLWVLNPWTAAIALHGVEVPISSFFWVLSVFVILHHRNLPSPTRLLWAFLLGALLGLTILARTDALLLLAAVLLTDFFREAKSGLRIDRLLPLLLISLGAFLITLPWWYWNWQNFGMLMQVSGKAVFLLAHGFQEFQAANALSRASFQTFMYLSYAITFSLLPLSIAWIACVRHSSTSKNQVGAIARNVIARLDFLFVSLLFLTAWYGLWQWHIQRWYFLVPIACLTIIVSFLMMHTTDFLSDVLLRKTSKLALCISILLSLLFYFTVGYGYPRQAGGYEIAKWLNNHTPQGAVVGSWNSGIVGFLAERKVINLDGVVNNSLYHYKVSRKADTLESMLDYLRIRKIDYLADYDAPLPEDLSALGMKRVHHSTQHGFTIFRLAE